MWRSLREAFEDPRCRPRNEAAPSVNAHYVADLTGRLRREEIKDALFAVRVSEGRTMTADEACG